MLIKIGTTIIFLAMLTFGYASVQNAQGSSSVTLEQVSNSTDFKMLLPTSLDKWNIEVKEPVSFELNTPITAAHLSFFNKSGDFIFSMTQHKATGYIGRREITQIDVSKKTMDTKVVEEEFKFNNDGTVVDWDGITARFEAWADGTPGGILRWIQNDTYVEMDSKKLSQNAMLTLARTMQ